MIDAEGSKMWIKGVTLLFVSGDFHSDKALV
jgi:hypothetical protein